ncbi:MAG: hypothetical protein WCS65_18010 [Verrucomicrobiae bacterium]
MIFFNFISSALVLGHVMASSGNPFSINIKGGGYSGTCTNQTCGITARMYLVMHEQDGAVSGQLDISSELGGGGPITGTMEGDQVTFTTVWEFGEITWFGRIKGKSIHGAYLVEGPDGLNQKGIWRVSRK